MTVCVFFYMCGHCGYSLPQPNHPFFGAKFSVSYHATYGKMRKSEQTKIYRYFCIWLREFKTTFEKEKTSKLFFLNLNFKIINIFVISTCTYRVHGPTNQLV